MIEAMLQRYPVTDAESHYQALREVMQEIALAGLYRGGFFQKAAFYGGTALRIFYQLDRFSEDLDFSLLQADPNFSLEPYFAAIRKEFHALGIQVEVSAKQKTRQTAVESAFLKSNTAIHLLQIQGEYTQSWSPPRPIKIKFEVDTQPPLGFGTEEKLLLLPFSFYVKCFQIGDLFAGKLHALLYRRWQNRVKGRDWYDFEWYVRHGHRVHLSHFLQRAQQSGQLVGRDSVSVEEVRELLRQRVEQVDFQQAKQDVARFIKHPERLEIWSQGYFQGLVGRLV
ncbi:Nucleotidyl transferase AbiEii toxin, Type IV TA system [Thiothrix caldifontis]|uniref:Nucleotidyl transferase AbiEii toxin, Type IV TA system n=1 Tax=Thiothrix caldifontis TaxID=525918 RepID=A0A1H4B5S3_9GAMM|nr:nucleotidyl transferase AbiEii/AbiGii toxin family protein [Thiothrix caldifontis]SEA43477.1 Nucleotidyl transferase AbiEii toxin, Type IV TA system [Thiothrix caldifontis]